MHFQFSPTHKWNIFHNVMRKKSISISDLNGIGSEVDPRLGSFSALVADAFMIIL